MKYFEKISFTEEQNKGLVKGILSGLGLSAGLTGIETARRYPHNPSFKKFMGIAKEKILSLWPIVGGSALLGAVIAKQKKEKEILRKNSRVNYIINRK
jgi:hypothetical protein